MVETPHTYYINKWFGGNGTDTGLLYRTGDMDDFIEHVDSAIKSYKLDSTNSRTIIRGDRTFFSFYEGNGKSAWEDVKFFSPPDALFRDFNKYKKKFGKAVKEVA